MTEDIKQITLKLVQGLARGKTEYKLPPIVSGYIKAIALMFKMVTTGCQRICHRVIKAGEVGDIALLEQCFVLTGSRQDLKLMVTWPAFGAYGTFSSNIQNRADLFEYAGGKLFKRMEMIEVSRPFQDLAKTLPALVDSTQCFVRSQRRNNGSV